MYHSITFSTSDTVTNGELTDGKNTWKDWHLIPTSRPVVAPPKFTTKYVEIPGRSGSLDISDYLTGSIPPGDRTGTIEFLIVNEYPNPNDPKKMVQMTDLRLANLQNTITNFFKGQKMKMVLEDDPTHYYQGRFWVSQWSPDPHNSKVTIEYHVNPSRYNLSSLAQA